MLNEFKEFAVKGNVVDMAVGVMIGAAFGGIVKSLVDDLLMPPLGLLIGDLDFSHRYVLLRAGEELPGPYTTLAAAQEAGAVVLTYGNFVNAAINFLIVAIALFFAVRWINHLRRPDTPEAPATKHCPHCKSAIHKDASRCPQCTSELAA